MSDGSNRISSSLVHCRSGSARGDRRAGAGLLPARSARCGRWRTPAAHLRRQVVAKGRLRLGRQVIGRPVQHQPPDREQLIDLVRGEVQVMGHARSHARVGLEEDVHPVLVSGQDHQQVVPPVLHHLQQDVDALLAVVFRVVGPVQGVGLVDEQHAAHRAVENRLVLGAVCPMNSPTRSSRMACTTWGFSR